MTNPKRIGEWELVRELGRGEFGQVFECRLVGGGSSSSQTWAMKAVREPPPSASSSSSSSKRKETKQETCARLLYWESEVYRLYANEHLCFPRLPPPSVTLRPYRGDQPDGSNNAWRYLVMERIRGGSLREQIESLSGRRPSRTAVMSVGVRVLNGLQALNLRKFVYRDLKPDNVCLTGDERGVVLVDFGTAQKFVDAKNEHFAGASGTFQSVGTPLFMSVNVHDGQPPSRRDDLESLGYLLVWALNAGAIPQWGSSKHEEAARSEADLLRLKQRTPLGEYGELGAYFEHVRGLEVESEPDYALLRALLVRLGGRERGPIDWSEEEEQDAVSSSSSSRKARGTKSSKPIEEEEDAPRSRSTLKQQQQHVQEATSTPPAVVSSKPAKKKRSPPLASSSPPAAVPPAPAPPRSTLTSEEKDEYRRVVKATIVAREVERAGCCLVKEQPPRDDHNNEPSAPPPLPQVTSSLVVVYTSILLVSLLAACAAVWVKHQL